MSCRASVCDPSAPRMRLATPRPCSSLAGGGGSAVIRSNCRVNDATPSALERPPPCLCSRRRRACALSCAIFAASSPLGGDPAACDAEGSQALR
eukprot:14845013-Alexandrium_andersonii.AAC.1